MGLPVRFAAPDSQRQGRGCVSSEMPVRINQQPYETRRSPKTRRKLQIASVRPPALASLTSATRESRNSGRSKSGRVLLQVRKTTFCGEPQNKR